MRKDVKKAADFVSNAVEFLTKVSNKATTPEKIRDEVLNIIEELERSESKINNIKDKYGT